LKEVVIIKVTLVKNILHANERLAQQNKAFFDEKKILVLNIMSAPGAGKTTLIEQTIRALGTPEAIGVIEGDIQSTFDAEKIATTGAQVVQINTGGACHLDGNMIRETFGQFDFNRMKLLIVENVGNLVCPAEFEIGEDFKVMLLSVPEGDDKPLKYPLMFQLSRVLLVNKIDLLPYTNCRPEKIRAEATRLNPAIEIFEISATKKTGLDPWYAWLRTKMETKR
jgi:hydrogenase nickel incorporation protein HypB